jgi:DNA-binding response OmpR family regulator
MSNDRSVVLVASRDPKQAVIRKTLLEQAGFAVRSALDMHDVEQACAEGKVAGVVIGWSVPVDDKRRVWKNVRAQCGSEVPIVELLRGGKAELLPDRALFQHEWNDETFADTVRKIFSVN